MSGHSLRFGAPCDKVAFNPRNLSGRLSRVEHWKDRSLLAIDALIGIRSRESHEFPAHETPLQSHFPTHGSDASQAAGSQSTQLSARPSIRGTRTDLGPAPLAVAQVTAGLSVSGRQKAEAQEPYGERHQDVEVVFPVAGISPDEASTYRA
jgi:hypothetical protein